MLLALLVAAPGAAQQRPDSVQHARTLQVGPGQQELVAAPGQIERVAIGDPEIAAVSVISAREVMLSGVERGRTSLLIWIADQKRPTRFPVVVGSADRPGVLDREQRAGLRTQV